MTRDENTDIIYIYGIKGWKIVYSFGLPLLGDSTSTAATFDEIKMSRPLYNASNFYVEGQRFILIENYFNLSNFGNNIHEKGLAVARKSIQKQTCECEMRFKNTVSKLY